MAMQERLLFSYHMRIGQIKPFSIYVKSEGSVSDEHLVKMIEKNFDLSPRGIIDYLQLTNTKLIKYREVASWWTFFTFNSSLGKKLNHSNYE